MADTVTHPYTAAGEVPVAYTDTQTRLAFLRKVYAFLGGSIILWAGTALYAVTNETLLVAMLKFVGQNPLVLLLVIFGVMFLLPRVVAKGAPFNYIGLGAFGVIQGLLTAPLIFVALLGQADLEVQKSTMEGLSQGTLNSSPVLAAGAGLLWTAFLLTACVFGGLSAYAITTKRDFSFLRGALWMGFWVLFGLGALSLFGVGGNLVMNWGFSLAWVLLMGGFVLFDTQRIMKTFPADQAPLAAAMLLANFVIMFKYILLLLSRRE
jgi:FtsH-binding integral membrane protein